MRTILSLIAMLMAVTLSAQFPTYYNNVNLNLDELSF